MVTEACEGCSGRSALARNWEQMSDRLSLTLRTLVSACRWSSADILIAPVATRSAAFWTDWRLLMADSEALGNQIGAAYEKRGLMSARKVVRSVSLECPQLVPARAFMTFRRPLAASVISLMWRAKVKCVSNVTPRMRGWRHRGSFSPPRLTMGSKLDWWESDVNKVTLDLGREIWRP